MKALKIVGVVLLGILGLAVLLYVIGVAVNWRDRPPSAAALEMRRLLADRAPVTDADNGFVYTLGFSVPPPADPQAAGALRRDWLEAVTRDPKLVHAEPAKEVVGFNASESRFMEGVQKACGGTQSGNCREAFKAALSQPRSTLHDLQLARYRALLQRPSWREVVPLDISAPLPAYAPILGGQRLLLVDLAARAKSASPGEIAALLREDLAFWRGVLRSADYLITKIIAVAAIRQHFFFGNLVLREMPGAGGEVIETWSVPFSVEELSMRRTMVGELAYGEAVMLNYKHGADGHFIEPHEAGLTLGGRITSSLARPYYQHQDQMNYYAESYLDLAKRFEVPLDRYPGIVESVEAGPDISSFHVYNPVGHVLRGITGPWIYPSYAIRVGSIEGQRRAALLTAQLRERGVALDAIPEELRGAELRNPFDGEPFEWSKEEQAVVYVGPDAERDRKRHAYFY